MSQKYKNDDLGTRMKGYETVSKSKVLCRTPVIIRVDGKAFHTYTKKFNAANDHSLIDSPFSHKLHIAMNQTACAMVQQIQNATIAYTQSDEISILLNDWKTLTTDQWYGGGIQKIASVAGSMATAYFNFFIQKQFCNNIQLDDHGPLPTDISNIPMFDARVFNIPKEEVANYFIWRQQDATRNSINMYARHFFSHKEMQGKRTSEVMDMLMLDKGVNWNDLETWKRRGSCAVRGSLKERLHPGTANEWAVGNPHNEVVIDDEIPIFTQDREYIDIHLKKVVSE